MFWKKYLNKNRAQEQRASYGDQQDKNAKAEYSVASQREFERAFQRAFAANEKAWERLAEK